MRAKIKRLRVSSGLKFDKKSGIKLIKLFQPNSRVQKHVC